MVRACVVFFVLAAASLGMAENAGSKSVSAGASQHVVVPSNARPGAPPQSSSPLPLVGMLGLGSLVSGLLFRR